LYVDPRTGRITPLFNPRTDIDLYRAMAMTFWLSQTEATLAQVEAR